MPALKGLRAAFVLGSCLDCLPRQTVVGRQQCILACPHLLDRAAAFFLTKGSNRNGMDEQELTVFIIRKLKEAIECGRGNTIRN